LTLTVAGQQYREGPASYVMRRWYRPYQTQRGYKNPESLCVYVAKTKRTTHQKFDVT